MAEIKFKKRQKVWAQAVSREMQFFFLVQVAALLISFHKSIEDGCPTQEQVTIPYQSGAVPSLWCNVTWCIDKNWIMPSIVAKVNRWF